MKLLKTTYSALFIIVMVRCLGAQNLPDSEPGDSASIVHVWVEHQGRLSIVHRQGDASPQVSLADIMESAGFWALGPLAGLRGEITVIDGQFFIARVINDTIAVSHETDIEAPFLVYGSVKRWQEVIIPDSVRTIPDLDIWLAHLADSLGALGLPDVFPFKVISSQSDVDFHVINNQEPGFQISRPHYELMRYFALQFHPLTLLGVFSKHHAGIFTHHDQWTHIHVVSADNHFAGHVDSLLLGSDAVLFIPEAE